MMPDFDAWIERISASRTAEQRRLEGIRDAALADRDKQARRTAKVEAKWAEYVDTDPHKAEVVLPIVEKERAACLGAETRLRAAEDALATVPTETPVDALLDFATALQRGLSGIDASGDSMAAVNAELRQTFAGFGIWREDDAIRIEPLLHLGVARRLLAEAMAAQGVERVEDLTPSEWTPWLVPEGAEPPPMRWLEAASRNERNTHES